MQIPTHEMKTITYNIDNNDNDNNDNTNKPPIRIT